MKAYFYLIYINQHKTKKINELSTELTGNLLTMLRGKSGLNWLNSHMLIVNELLGFICYTVDWIEGN